MATDRPVIVTLFLFQSAEKSRGCVCEIMTSDPLVRGEWAPVRGGRFTVTVAPFWPLVYPYRAAIALASATRLGFWPATGLPLPLTAYDCAALKAATSAALCRL